MPEANGIVGSSRPRPLRPTAGPSCDQCRDRKVRCIPGSPIRGEVGHATTVDSASASVRSRCTACFRRDETCTYLYTYRKPGRPKSQRARRSQSRISSSPQQSVPPAVHFQTPSSDNAPPLEGTTRSTIVSPSLPTHASPQTAPHKDPPLESLNFFGSARQTFQSPATFSFDYNLPASHFQFDTTTAAHEDPASGSLDLFTANVAPANTGPESQGNFDDLRPFLRDIGQPPMSLFAGTPEGATTSTAQLLTGQSEATAHVPVAMSSGKPGQIEDIASWGDISFLISLHVRYQHALVPLCHQPSLARDILHRRDQKDEAFRCFLLSVASYTICQCPVQSLLARMDRETLEALLRRAQRATRVMQIRHQMKPSLLILASTVLDWITSQATTSVELSDNLLSDIRRLSYGLNLHKAEPREGMSRMELEVSRRIFWEAYVIDKTNALNGHPILMHDADGLPPFPQEVDDDMIPTHGPNVLPQPPRDPSYMIGFGAVARIFQWIYRCQWRHRMFVTDPAACADRHALQLWIEDAKSALKHILDALPMQLRPEFTASDTNPSTYGMQAANVCITSLCLELALLDFKSSLSPDQDTAAERSTTARRVLGELEKIPIQCLALNGESMRGKVLRVVLALLNVSNRSEELGSSVWDWWSIYSRVQFLQIIPAHAPPVVPTRPQSPI